MHGVQYAVRGVYCAVRAVRVVLVVRCVACVGAGHLEYCGVFLGGILCIGAYLGVYVYDCRHCLKYTQLFKSRSLGRSTFNEIYF